MYTKKSPMYRLMKLVQITLNFKRDIIWIPKTLKTLKTLKTPS